MFINLHVNLRLKTNELYKETNKRTNKQRENAQGPHSHILLTGGGGGGPRDFLGLEFWPKGIFLVYGRRCEFLVSRKKTGIFLGSVLFISANQQ